MLLQTKSACILLCALTPLASSFVGTFRRPAVVAPQQQQQAPAFLSPLFAERPREQSVLLDTTLTDDKVASLFAWIAKAFAADDPRYNNLMMAIAAVFGNLDDDHELRQMVNQAREEALPENDNNEEVLIGDPLSLSEREQASLGAMGAWQWESGGIYKTRPHSLLELTNFTTIDDYIQSLPRGCKRTLKNKALNNPNFTVTIKPIRGGAPAPHSALAHFRCVVEHEVRLLSSSDGTGEGFIDALAEAISRYLGTTRQAGDIYEYRNATGSVIAIAHQIHKGKTIRGQWFYANDQAAQEYVWFHSVYELVKRGIATEGVTVVDLGPSGSKAFEELKERYGFQRVVDWSNVADYLGDFQYYKTENDGDDTSKII